MADINVTTLQPHLYKDLSLTFSKNPITNDVIAVTGEDAVKRSIKNLLLTQVGEVPFFPQFGSRLNWLLFEPIDPVTTTLLVSEIRATIEGFEPRVSIQTLTVNATPDESAYQVSIIFRLLNQIDPITLTLFLSRLR
jgi:phage baseplate assembly protein W